jgi:hypothetical protein
MAEEESNNKEDKDKVPFKNKVIERLERLEDMTKATREERKAERKANREANKRKRRARKSRANITGLAKFQGFRTK